MLDIKTAFIFVEIISAINAVTFFVLWRTHRDIRGITTITLGSLTLTIAFLLMNFSTPIFLTASNSSMALAIGLIADGTAVLIQGKSRLSLVLVLTFIAVIFWELAQWLAPSNVVIRIIAATFIYLIFYTILLFNLFKSKNQINIAKKGMIFAIFAHCLVLVARMVISIFHDDPYFVFSPAFLPWFLFENASITILNFFFILITIGGQLDEALKQKTLSLTAERQMHSQLRHFLSMLGHELQTPLTIIDRSAELSQELLSPEQPAIYRRLETIRSAVERARGLMDNLIMAERVQLEVSDAQTIDLNRLVYDITRLLSDKYEDGRILVTMPSSSNFVPGNREMLAAAIGNILDNALKYSKPNQAVQVIIESQERDRHVTLTVIDHGIGFPAHQIDQIGQRFFRSDNVGPTQGTGLGLSITKTIIDKHDGQIEFRNGPSGGAIVILKLPRSNLQASAPAAE